jgi:hypothetical protein
MGQVQPSPVPAISAERLSRYMKEVSTVTSERDQIDYDNLLMAFVGQSNLATDQFGVYISQHMGPPGKTVAWFVRMADSKKIPRGCRIKLRPSDWNTLVRLRGKDDLELVKN